MAAVTKEKVETERVQVLMPVDLLARVKRDAERREMSMSALIVEHTRAGVSGGVAPVVMQGPTAEENAAALKALLPGVATQTLDLEPVLAKLDDAGHKLTLIYREALTLREMTKDRVAERYIDHGMTKAAGEAAAREMYELARGKAQDEMKAAS